MRDFRPQHIVGAQLPSTQAVNGHAERFRVSQTSTAAYDDGRKGRCTAKKNTCKGFAVKGSTLCAGHSRAAKKAVTDAAD